MTTSDPRTLEITNFRQGLDQIVLNPNNNPGDTGATAYVNADHRATPSMSG